MATRRTLAMAPILALLMAALVIPTASAAPTTGRYIVVLKDSAAPHKVANKHKAKHGVKVKNVYKHTIKGYAAKVKGTEVAALRKDPAVAFVEKDRRASIDKRNKPPRSQPPADDPYTFASWGIDRIDQRDLPLSESYGVGANGSGVTAYVVDTGIRISHNEFGNRARSGHDFVDKDKNADDCDGHGTHVAGTIGGSTYGVARNVALVGVRVLDCNGSGWWSDIIDGIDWAVGNAGNSPAVINMSLGGGASSAVDAAVTRAINAGVVVVTSAGNSSADACRYSPARVPAAITVGSTTRTDSRSSFSNYGRCVDLFAPGSSIKSAWIGGSGATNTISGTSMSAPHVAGAAALVLDDSPNASPAVVAQAIGDKSSKGKLSLGNNKVRRDTPNRLLFVGSW